MTVWLYVRVLINMSGSLVPVFLLACIGPTANDCSLKNGSVLVWLVRFSEKVFKEILIQFSLQSIYVQIIIILIIIKFQLHPYHCPPNVIARGKRPELLGSTMTGAHGHNLTQPSTGRYCRCASLHLQLCRLQSDSHDPSSLLTPLLLLFQILTWSFGVIPCSLRS